MSRTHLLSSGLWGEDMRRPLDVRSVSPAGQKPARLRGEAGILPLGDRIVWFLTGNRNKFLEARSILVPFGVRVRHLRISKVEIQNPRPENIARFALEEALKTHRLPIVVEDSGIFIRGLSGFPGPYSSFIYKTIGLEGILSVLGARRDRNAYFQSTVAYGSPSTRPRTFTGIVRGRISRRILGTSGFGYDPIFIPRGYNTTFGQTGQAFKNATSHRARAFQHFAKWFVGSSAATVKN